MALFFLARFGLLDCLLDWLVQKNSYPQCFCHQLFTKEYSVLSAVKLSLESATSAGKEGCPILRQIYAWHCIVFISHNNTVQKHNNKE